MPSFSRLFHQLRTPGHQRSVLLRRILAMLLVCAAAILALHSRSNDPKVVVFTGALEAGQMITINDIKLQERPESYTPEGAFTATEDVLGTVAVSAAQPGEVVTSARFISSELTATLVHGKNSDEITGEKSGEPGLESVHMVPISLADPEIIPLLNHGDTVSVITEDASGNSQTSFGADHRDAERGAENGLGLDAVDHAGIDHARNSISPYSGGPGQIESNTVIAEGARVILAREATSAGNRATVMLALPASAAQRVAVASLASPLTVVLTGERATGRDAH
ncbi:SAF domain-containing protein [Corynebacterium pseudodiphtheriticum]|uniref:SAF domain-containing protein n=1 Tax=Corynebacterium pseudodiphtheriticum TaxID=37637 RepID=A0ABT7FTN6_9CORY|nr:SAF domain-containing protein [Corynebacterium pseudodiphtheriticum]MDC7110285.1 SAF domain-containing protein [Corynebacterium pseudodiphtheriticum]MDC7114240.1 SAF domain-containing protein [Corynebacterium pseudodiphtheriticum]MDK4205753.1 SAF domain-containing protein [Corynebacterium pseudodiphtheriticum]MDK4236028.1 SAF domain-containing protein [Corynebacterium pseudodiphtheriticum]MDK4289181.1 SAF domain-containing protein [Corynebacterium pseudodiphtheriticum]